jgi:hypothetical protein
LVLNLANNDLGKFDRGALKEKPSWWRESYHGGTYGWSDDHYEQGKAEGIIALADAIPDMGALSVLNLAKNRFQGAEAGKALGDAIAVNTVIKELDISGGELWERCDVEFVQAFAVGLRDNGAMTTLNLSGNAIGAYYDPNEGVVASPEGMNSLWCTCHTSLF